MTRHLLTSTRLTRLPIALILLFAFTVSAQPPDTAWVRDFGFSSSERVEVIRPCQDGGYILTGDSREGTGILRVRTVRISEDGEVIWNHVEGGDDLDGAEYIEPTSDGGFIQGGSTRSFSPTLGEDAFVRKLNADGDQEWARLFGTDNIDDWVACVREVSTGGYIAVGLDDTRPFLWRLGPNGQHLWVRHWPSEFDNRLNFVEPLADGGFILGGSYPDWFTLVKTNTQGEVIWTQEYWDNGGIYCVREFPNGNLIASGRRYYSELTFAWVVILTDPDGEIIWTREINENNFTSQEAYECWITVDGNIVVCGLDQDEDFSLNSWILKYDTVGNTLWHWEITGGELFTICQGRDGGYVVGGMDHDNWTTPSLNFKATKLYPEVQITLHPWTPTIPVSGGLLRYGAQVTNILVDQTPLDAWIVVTGPNGERVPLNSFPVTLQPGATFTRPQITVWVPGYAPNGEYTLEAHLGVVPPTVPPGGPSGSRNMGLGSFTFTKVDGR